MEWALPVSEAKRNAPETTHYSKAENSIAELGTGPGVRGNSIGFSVISHRFLTENQTPTTDNDLPPPPNLPAQLGPPPGVGYPESWRSCRCV
jgi:hypothetical protein